MGALFSPPSINVPPPPPLPPRAAAGDELPPPCRKAGRLCGRGGRAAGPLGLTPGGCSPGGNRAGTGVTVHDPEKDLKKPVGETRRKVDVLVASSWGAER